MLANEHRPSEPGMAHPASRARVHAEPAAAPATGRQTPQPEAHTDALAGQLARAVQRRAVRAPAVMIARMQIQYVPDRTNMSAKVKTSTMAMTDAELHDVVANLLVPYTASEVRGAKTELDERARIGHSGPRLMVTAKTPRTGPDPAEVLKVQALVQPTMDRIDSEAAAIVDVLNEPATLDADFTQKFLELKKLKVDVFKDFNDAIGSATVDEPALKAVRADFVSRLNIAVTRTAEIVRDAPTTKERVAMLAKKAIKYPGAKTLMVKNYEAPTTESTIAVSRPGVVALKTLGFTDSELHHVVNAIRQGYEKSNDPDAMVERWLVKLDEMAGLWSRVKPGSAEAWLRKALLPKGTDLYAHFKGMYGELWETHRVLAESEVAAGTLIRMGKDKVRPEAPGMKAAATTTQDIDLSFHGVEGRRHYHEIKADPDTIVGKIGGDEAKTAVVAGPLGPPDPVLASTPDQVLSYASARDAHNLKSATRYPGGKNIVLMYVSPGTKNWLRIFTSKAAQRLIAHGFELRVADVLFDAALLTLVQAKVNKEAPPGPGDVRDDWARDHSGLATHAYYDPKKYLATL